MTKQEHIEEMTNILTKEEIEAINKRGKEKDELSQALLHCATAEASRGIKSLIDCEVCAFYLYENLGYRKLPKDSVVLSREEYEKLKRIESEKDRLYEIKLDLENQLIEKGWTDYEGADEIEKRVSKETAEKILNDLVKNCQYTFNIDGKPIVELDGDFVLNAAKSYGVKIKE